MDTQTKIIKMPKPLDYQLDILNILDDPTIKFVTFLKSRQSGGSFLNKMLVVKWGLENPNCRIGYITPTLKLSKLFFKELCDSLEPYIAKKNSTDLIIEFVTKTTVQFFSAESTDSIRGFQFEYLVIDEAAFMKSDFFDMVVRPTILIKGRKVILCSTPNTANGFFHQHYMLGIEDQRHSYASKKITIYDNPFVSEEEISTIKSTVPDRVFKQEYLSEFLDGEGAVFSNFKQCIGTGKLNGEYYAAIDWAKENDYTVLTIMNSLKEVVYIGRWTGLDYTVQVDMISQILHKWSPKLVTSEENNIGSVVNELLKKAYNGRIKQITLDNRLKREIIESLIVAFETNSITIPDNEDLLNELSWFSVTYNHQTQTVKYAAKSGLHDDMIISLAYAYNSVNKKAAQYAIR